jgi:hypothetical protein
MKLALVLVVAACGSGGPAHWKDQPIETQSAETDGVKFTIDLPKGMEKSKVESKYSVDWQYHQDGRAYAPMLSISHMSKRQNDDEKTTVSENSSQKGKDDWLVDSQKIVGDGSLSCHARVYAMRKDDDVKALIPLVEKMCLSVKAQP